MKLLPVPVAPITITFCLARTQPQVAMDRMMLLSMPRVGLQKTSSIHAFMPSLACLIRAARRRFCRSVHSRSTMSASLSSKGMAEPSAEAISSRTASAITLRCS